MKGNPFRFLAAYMGKPLWTWEAWSQGIEDGFAEPYDLGHGLTFECTRLNVVYDQGANLGQYVGQLSDSLSLWWAEETKRYA